MFDFRSPLVCADLETFLESKVDASVIIFLLCILPHLFLQFSKKPSIISDGDMNGGSFAHLQLCDRFISRKRVQRIYDKALTDGLKGYAQLYVLLPPQTCKQPSSHVVNKKN